MGLTELALGIVELVTEEWVSIRTVTSDSRREPNVYKGTRSKLHFLSAIGSVLVVMKVKVIGLRKYICIFRNHERDREYRQADR